MNRVRGKMASALIAYSMGCTSFAASGTDINADMHLFDGRLYVDQRLMLDSFSVIRTHQGYLFFYIPDFGLVTIGTSEFPGAQSSGGFNGSTIKFAVHGKNFLIEASKVILSDGDSPAWVRVDTSYSIETKSPMVGYGNSLTTPYHWPRYIRNAE